MFERLQGQENGAVMAPAWEKVSFGIERSQGLVFRYERRVASDPGFGELLRRLIEDGEKISVSAWADRVGTSNGQIFNVIAGRRTPDLIDARKWAEDLGLKGRERELFLDLAAVAHLPEEVQERFIKLIYEQRHLVASEADLRRRVAQLEEKYGG